MAFTDDIVLNDGGALQRTYALVKQTNDGTERMSTSSTLTEPDLMVIRHSTQNVKGIGTVDRHLVQFSSTRRDSVTGVIATGIVNTTIQVPRHPALTENVMWVLLTAQELFIDGTSFSKLLRGER